MANPELSGYDLYTEVGVNPSVLVSGHDVGVAVEALPENLASGLDVGVGLEILPPSNVSGLDYGIEISVLASSDFSSSTSGSGTRDFLVAFEESKDIALRTVGNEVRAVWKPSVGELIGGYRIWWGPDFGEFKNSEDVGLNVCKKISSLVVREPIFVQIETYAEGYPGYKRLSQPKEIRVSEPEIEAYQRGLSNKPSIFWVPYYGETDYEVQVDSEDTFTTPNKKTVNVSRTDVYLTGYVEFEHVYRRAGQTWYSRMRRKDLDGLFPWSDTFFDILKLNNVNTRRLQDGFTEVLSVENLSRDTVYNLGTDYVIDGNSVVKVNPDMPDYVFVSYKIPYKYKIRNSKWMELKDSLMKSLDPTFYEISSGTTDVDRWFKILSREYEKVWEENAVFGLRRFLSTALIDDLGTVYGGLMPYGQEVSSKWYYNVIKSLFSAYTIGGTKQALRIAVAALVGRPPVIRDHSRTFLVNPSTVPPVKPWKKPLDTSVYVGRSGVLHEGTMLVASSRIRNIYVITIYNPCAPAKVQINKLNNQSLGHKNLISGSFGLMKLNGTFVDPSQYSVDYVNGIFNWVGIPTEDLYWAIYYYKIEDILIDICNSLLDAGVRVIYKFIYI